MRLVPTGIGSQWCLPAESAPLAMAHVQGEPVEAYASTGSPVSRYEGLLHAHCVKNLVHA